MEGKTQFNTEGRFVEDVLRAVRFNLPREKCSYVEGLSIRIGQRNGHAREIKLHPSENSQTPIDDFDEANQYIEMITRKLIAAAKKAIADEHLGTDGRFSGWRSGGVILADGSLYYLTLPQ